MNPFRRILTCVAVAVAFQPIARSAETTPDSRFDSTYEWQTGASALLCRSYAAVKEAVAAVRIHDFDWLQELGCAFLGPGLRIVLIDATNKPNAVTTVWHGRVYPKNGTAAFNAYFQGVSAVTYALYGPFKSEKAARRETTRLFESIRLATPKGWGNIYQQTAYQILGNPDAFTVRIGPEQYSMMNLVCLNARGLPSDDIPPCKVTGTFPEAQSITIPQSQEPKYNSIAIAIRGAGYDCQRAIKVWKPPLMVDYDAAVICESKTNGINYVFHVKDMGGKFVVVFKEKGSSAMYH